MELDRDAHHALVRYLAEVRQSRGAPSLRAISAQTVYSHTTVARVFNPAAPLPSWPIVEQVARSLRADEEHARRLWDRASTPITAVHGPGRETAAGDGEPPLPPVRIMLLLLGMALCVGMIVVAVSQAADTSEPHGVAVTDLTQIVFGSSAAGILLVRVWRSRRRGDRLNTTYFGLLAAAVSAWTGGQVAWFVARTIHHQTIPGGHIHDIGYLAMPVFAAAALWMRARRLGVSRVRNDIDNAAAYFCVFCGAYAAMLWLLVLLRHDVGSPATLVFAAYPATDITLSLAALVPLICGRRIIGSAFLCTALLAAASSDTSYLLRSTTPHTHGYPPTAGLGYIAFTSILTVWALIAHPLPATNQSPRPIQHWPAQPSHVITAATGIAATITTTATALTLNHPLPPPSQQHSPPWPPSQHSPSPSLTSTGKPTTTPT
ncbi:helix-turn-helix domain-containing protein [Nocardia terpenica]|uniref:Helix-turn-helix domain-containing protein n=1 Tax=Nocardia terpenica TaxID=455432 RepID=A0A6G9Z7J5_9NOCA|nr:helix-turn-helix domain-containing protein [Nocardia terpenica]QIS21488.1 hypothetical protein F6W96_27285 [Nocardia terpenica]